MIRGALASEFFEQRNCLSCHASFGHHFHKNIYDRFRDLSGNRLEWQTIARQHCDADGKFFLK